MPSPAGVRLRIQIDHQGPIRGRPGRPSSPRWSSCPPPFWLATAMIEAGPTGWGAAARSTTRYRRPIPWFGRRGIGRGRSTGERGLGGQESSAAPEGSSRPGPTETSAGAEGGRRSIPGRRCGAPSTFGSGSPACVPGNGSPWGTEAGSSSGSTPGSRPGSTTGFTAGVRVGEPVDDGAENAPGSMGGSSCTATSSPVGLVWSSSRVCAGHKLAKPAASGGGLGVIGPGAPHGAALVIHRPVGNFRAGSGRLFHVKQDEIDLRDGAVSRRFT
jgi:hypothetical protein